VEQTRLLSRSLLAQRPRQLDAGQLITPLSATRSRVIVCVLEGGNSMQHRYLPYPRQRPMRACWPRAVRMVRSPADNVPKWVQMATGELLR
jgi:hypothetical protein